MYERYWDMYVEIKQAERYYWHYKIRSEHTNRLICAILCITSCASIATWGIWQQFQIVWAAIIAVSQTLSATQHLFPYSKQTTAINYLLPELDRLLININRDWYMVQNKWNDETINEKIAKYQSEFSQLEHKYIGDTCVPQVKKCAREAERDRILYFFERYGIAQVERLEEKV